MQKAYSKMTLTGLLEKLPFQEDLNFLLTNRIPRRLATRFVGWLSKVEHPLVRDASIGIWRAFAKLDLSEAKKSRFSSMHDCFTRELKPGVRPIDERSDILTSPCDGIVGACGHIADVDLFQVKGFPYRLGDLVPDPDFIRRYRDGLYVTLRLTSSMYHRFHAPADGCVEQVTYMSGDTWNVNPIALKRIEKLFCKNERAALRMRLSNDHQVTLVPVAAILVASIRLHCLDALVRHRGAGTFTCNVAYRKGEEMGWFEHGSTIIVFAPEGFSLCPGIVEGQTIKMGQALMQAPG